MSTTTDTQRAELWFVQNNAMVGAGATALLAEMFAFGGDLMDGALVGAAVLVGNRVAAQLVTVFTEITNGAVVGLLGSVLLPAVILRYARSKPLAEGAVVGLAALGGATLMSLGVRNVELDVAFKKAWLAGDYQTSNSYYSNI